MTHWTLDSERTGDGNLSERVRNALSLRLGAAQRRIDVESRGDLVTLRGRTASYYERQLACEIVRRVPGVHRIMDELTVTEEANVKAEPTGPLLTAVSLRRRAGVAAGLGLLLLVTMSGCGGDGIKRLPVHPVQGQVTWNGKPLANALVVLHPKAPSTKEPFSARGQTAADGTFQLTTYDTNDGAPEGEYSVTVQYYQLVQQGQSFEPGPNVLPAKLASPLSTDIVVRVASGKNNLPPIEVSR